METFVTYIGHDAVGPSSAVQQDRGATQRQIWHEDSENNQQDGQVVHVACEVVLHRLSAVGMAGIFACIHDDEWVQRLTYRQQA